MIDEKRGDREIILAYVKLKHFNFNAAKGKFFEF